MTFPFPFFTPGAAGLPGPADIGTALTWWYRSDLGVTESGGTVSAWADQSSNARNVSEATNKPAYSATGGPNSVPSITFDGTNDKLMSSTFGPIAQPFHVFNVFKIVSWAHADYILGLESFDKVNLQQRDITGQMNQGNFNGVVIGTTNYGLVQSFWSGASSYQQLNNGTATTPSSAGSTAMNIVRFASDRAVTVPGNVAFVEAFAYPAQITGTDLATLLTYINTRYSLW